MKTISQHPMLIGELLRRSERRTLNRRDRKRRQLRVVLFAAGAGWAIMAGAWLGVGHPFYALVCFIVALGSHALAMGRLVSRR